VTAGGSVLGQPVVLPFAIAPTGFTRLMQTEASSPAPAPRGSGGIPFSLSTLGTRAIEDVVTAVPTGRKWFQLYMWRDRTGRWRWSSGRPTRVRYVAVTVDVPVAGARRRDVRNGMSIPPALTCAPFSMRRGARAGGSIC